MCRQQIAFIMSIPMNSSPEVHPLFYRDQAELPTQYRFRFQGENIYFYCLKAFKPKIGRQKIFVSVRLFS